MSTFTIVLFCVQASCCSKADNTEITVCACGYGDLKPYHCTVCCVSPSCAIQMEIRSSVKVKHHSTGLRSGVLCDNRKNVFSQCIGPVATPCGTPCAGPLGWAGPLGGPIGSLAGPLAGPLGWAGPLGGSIGPLGGPLGGPCGAYGGAGIGEVSVAGELPVAGSTLVAGQVPILGAVEFCGPVCAGGAVTIAGSCACGCAGPRVI